MHLVGHEAQQAETLKTGIPMHILRPHFTDRVSWMLMLFELCEPCLVGEYRLLF